MKLIAVRLLVVGPIALVQPCMRNIGCAFSSAHRVVASGTVYCDQRKTEVPENGTVTLMDLDNDEDDLAEVHETLPGVKPSVSLDNGRFELGGSMTDGWAGYNSKPYLLVTGVCPVEDLNAEVELKQLEEKFRLPCNFACNENEKSFGGIIILLDGVSESPICS